MNIFKKLLGAAALALIGFAGLGMPTAAKAQTPATCINYIGSGAYPAFYVCFPSNQPVDTARRNEVVQAISTLPSKNNQSAPNEVKDVLQFAGVVYHYAYDRAYYNQAMIDSGHPERQDTHAGRCGDTEGTTTGTIVSVVYEVCELSNGTRFINPNLRRAILHESGHSFALAIGKLYRGGTANGPDVSTAWKTLMQYDLNHITPSDWATVTNGQPVWPDSRKTSLYCVTVFTNIALSSLEQDFGGAPATPVCTNGATTSYYLSRTPRQIIEEKMPYFVKNTNGVPANGSNLELWAQLFVIRHDTSGQGQVNFLKFTDKVLGLGAWQEPPQQVYFKCTKIAMQYFYTDPHLTPPASAFSGSGCPAVTW